MKKVSNGNKFNPRTPKPGPPPPHPTTKKTSQTYQYLQNFIRLNTHNIILSTDFLPKIEKSTTHVVGI
jgi:hypothetical protein